MEWHQRGFSRAKGVKGQENGGQSAIDLACEDAARPEFEAACHLPGPENRKQQETHRSAEQDAQVDSTRSPRLIVPVVGHEGISRERENFVEKK